MHLDSVTAEIRPRSDWEAADLGLAMVRRDFWPCFTLWWLALLLPTLGAACWLWDSPMLCLLLFWWWKPAGSRLVLFELSRRLFGERPAWRSSLRQIPPAWTRRFFYRFVWARFSPWLPVTLAVEDLEGLRGVAYKRRCRQVTRRGEGVVMWLYGISDMAACWFGLAFVLLVKMFIPDGQDSAWRLAMESWDADNPMSLPLLLLRVVVACVMLAMSLTDIFVTGAGFGIYINNRAWIEGWDVELAFKRLAARLARPVLLAGLLCALWLPAVSRAEAPRDAAQVIREVKADEAFKVHTVMVRESHPSQRPFSWNGSQWMPLASLREGVRSVTIVLAVSLLAAAILWLLWNHRHVLRISNMPRKSAAPSSARVVMGLEIAPESLPDDVPGAVRSLWLLGRPHEALGLLYRAAISRVITLARVEIQPSDTEGDCLRRVDLAGPAAYPDYFRGLTDVRIRLAYAGGFPVERELDALCRQWPYGEGGAR
jgi:hypothetical protein